MQLYCEIGYINVQKSNILLLPYSASQKKLMPGKKTSPSLCVNAAEEETLQHTLRPWAATQKAAVHISH